MSRRDLGVRAAASFSADMRKPSSGVVGTTTGSALARRAISVYDTQYGAGMMTCTARVREAVFSAGTV